MGLFKTCIVVLLLNIQADTNEPCFILTFTWNGHKIRSTICLTVANRDIGRGHPRKAQSILPQEGGGEGMREKCLDRHDGKRERGFR